MVDEKTYDRIKSHVIRTGKDFIYFNQSTWWLFSSYEHYIDSFKNDMWVIEQNNKLKGLDNE